MILDDAFMRKSALQDQSSSHSTKSPLLRVVVCFIHRTKRQGARSNLPPKAKQRSQAAAVQTLTSPNIVHCSVLVTMQEIEEDVSPSELQEKLKEYSSFIDSTLYPELRRTVMARESTEGEIKEYQVLYDKLAVLQHHRDEEKTLQAMVNLGHELVYCQAEVDDPLTVFVDVGKGFFVELTLADALPVIQKRISFLQQEMLPKRVQDASRVASHLESSIMIVEALARHVKELEG